jgi:hypothetical protein
MEKLLNGDIDEWEVTDPDHRMLLDEALDAWDRTCIAYGVDEYEVEQTFELNAETGGTADVVAYATPERTLIVDWKFGQGIAVEAEGNMQGLFYAMVSEGKPGGHIPGNDLTLVIIQPIPSREDNETCKIWNVPADVYETFKRTYVAAQKSVGLHSGDHCRWCPASATCKEKSGEAVLALTMDPDKVESLVDALALVDKVKAWAKQVEKTAHDQLELGNAITGWKLVQKRATRKWDEPSEAEQFVRQHYLKGRSLKVSEFTEQKFLSAPALEKVFKAKGLDFGMLSAHIGKTSTGNTLAREDDPREGIMSANALKQALGRLT